MSFRTLIEMGEKAMLGTILFVLLFFVEIIFMLLSLMKKSDLKKEKSVVRITLFVFLILLVISPIIDWSMRWTLLGLLLGIQALLGIVIFVRKKENTESKTSRIILVGLVRVLIMGIVVLPVIIFPQYDPIKPSGNYSVGTKSYTLTDESRKEYFTEEDDNRKVTLQIWYPSNHSGEEEFVDEGKFPLVVFSHGAFGYRLSNYSTFQELASHGYTVCSIDHTYHAFMTKQEDGETILGDTEFMNDAMKAQNEEISAEKAYELEQKWLKLRTEDMTFVLNYIKKMTASASADPVFKSTDIERIGILGHSLGGATAAQMGRDDEEVDAVVVIDGTMLGEIIGFEEGKEVITDVPFPKPILNIYNELHYEEALKLQDGYANIATCKNALNSYQVMIEGSGHINFTDLPIISPSLSKLLGTGDVDARYCIETTNAVILQFLDRYLKLNDDSEIPKVRTFL